ncbi:winged helix-turn-helix transcriptional regulator [Nocardia macrotermitis]|uniref:Putative HTH-type transcriptional regulator YybR n=1 Tax=Nocardia macrotermitis TaxID=2585198 RepID=A0A7K0D3K1_9NOCA|nr:helix-turn-helix domain-containing protein [Nocardia macrotermitis]MQY19504.1 putative HTH-type transcriptional regulator YybR [Nocardia macrotermitis]
MTQITPKPVRIPDTGAVREIFDRIGDKWSLLLIGTLHDAPLRYGELKDAIPGISQRMLTRTLSNLVEDGLVTRTAYAEVPPRIEYALTDLGRTLLPMVADLAEWAMAHRDEINANRTSRGRVADDSAAE